MSIQFEAIANELDRIQFEMKKDAWLKLGVAEQEAAQFSRQEILEERARRNAQTNLARRIARLKAQSLKIKIEMAKITRKDYNYMIRQRNQGAGIDELEQALNQLTM